MPRGRGDRGNGRSGFWSKLTSNVENRAVANNSNEFIFSVETNVSQQIGDRIREKVRGKIGRRFGRGEE